MAAIPVVLVGVTGDGQPIIINGSLAYSDRQVGGGPIDPPHIWGPTDPRPTPPIYLPPPGEPPLVIWGPDDPRPTVPIYWPGFPAWPPTEQPPDPPPAGKWAWRYTDEYGWVLDPPGGGGKPQPVP